MSVKSIRSVGVIGLLVSFAVVGLNSDSLSPDIVYCLIDAELTWVSGDNFALSQPVTYNCTQGLVDGEHDCSMCECWQGTLSKSRKTCCACPAGHVNGECTAGAGGAACEDFDLYNGPRMGEAGSCGTCGFNKPDKAIGNCNGIKEATGKKCQPPADGA